MSVLAGVGIVCGIFAVHWAVTKTREIHVGVWRVVNDVDRIKRKMDLE